MSRLVFFPIQPSPSLSLPYLYTRTSIKKEGKRKHLKAQRIVGSCQNRPYLKPTHFNNTIQQCRCVVAAQKPSNASFEGSIVPSRSETGLFQSRPYTTAMHTVSLLFNCKIAFYSFRGAHRDRKRKPKRVSSSTEDWALAFDPSDCEYAMRRCCNSLMSISCVLTF